MKIRNIFAAAGLVFAAMGVGNSAQAQPVQPAGFEQIRYDNGNHRGWDRRDNRRWDHGDRRNWNRHDRRHWQRGRHYRSARHCWTEYRHRRPVRICR